MGAIVRMRIKHGCRIKEQLLLRLSILSYNPSDTSPAGACDGRSAGKCIAEIIAHHDARLDLPIMMCDTLSANIP